MDLFQQKQDDAVQNIIKVYLAQMDSAMKISKIIYEHSGEEELTGDHIICGLIYRLMVSISDEDMIDSLQSADNILNDIDDYDEYDEYGEDSDEDLEYEIPSEKRKLKTNNCDCNICSKVKECIEEYHSYEAYLKTRISFIRGIFEECPSYEGYLKTRISFI